MDITPKLKHINLLVSGRCNLHCKMCDYNMEASRRKELTFSEVEKIIKDSCEIGLERLDLSGGEPMLREDIYDIISLAKALNVRTLLVTNGTLIEEKEAAKLIEAGLSAVIISLEGYEETNDFIRGKGSFKKAVKAIAALKQYRKHLDYINVGITVSRVNFRELYSFTQFLIEEMNIDSISYNPFDRNMLCNDSYEEMKNIFLITPEIIGEFEAELQKLIHYAKTKKVRLSPEYYLCKIPDYFEGKSVKPLFPCCEPLLGCAINSSGDVFGCWGQQEKAVGNISVSSIQSLIHSNEYIDVCKKALTLKCNGCLKACYVDIHKSYLY